MIKVKGGGFGFQAENSAAALQRVRAACRSKVMKPIFNRPVVYGGTEMKAGFSVAPPIMAGSTGFTHKKRQIHTLGVSMCRH